MADRMFIKGADFKRSVSLNLTVKNIDSCSILERLIRSRRTADCSQEPEHLTATSSISP